MSLRSDVRRLPLATLFLAVGLTACNDQSTAPQDDTESSSPETALALFLVETDATAGWSQAVLTDQRTGTREFSRSGSCPAGGTRSVSGAGTARFTEATRVLETEWSTTQTHDGCGVVQRRERREMVVVVDGVVTVSGTASYRIPADRTGTRDVLSYASSRQGVLTTTFEGGSRTCAIDIRETYDPISSTFRVQGVVCGRTIDFTRGLRASRDG